MKLHFSVFIFSLLTFLFSACSSETSVDGEVDQGKSDEHYLLGLEFAQYSLYQNALDELDIAIKYNPGDWKAYNKKGLIYFGIKEYAFQMGKLYLSNG